MESTPTPPLATKVTVEFATTFHCAVKVTLALPIEYVLPTENVAGTMAEPEVSQDAKVNPARVNVLAAIVKSAPSATSACIGAAPVTTADPAVYVTVREAFAVQRAKRVTLAVNG